MVGVLVDVGFGYQVQLSKIYAIIPYGNMASKALLRYKKKDEDFTTIKCTRGRKARSLVLMDDGGLFVSPLSIEDLKKNITEERAGAIRE